MQRYQIKILLKRGGYCQCVTATGMDAHLDVYPRRMDCTKIRMDCTERWPPTPSRGSRPSWPESVRRRVIGTDSPSKNVTKIFNWVENQQACWPGHPNDMTRARVVFLQDGVWSKVFKRWQYNRCKNFVSISDPIEDAANDVKGSPCGKAHAALHHHLPVVFSDRGIYELLPRRLHIAFGRR